MTFDEKKQEIVENLQKAGFVVEHDNTSVSFALSKYRGLSGVWAEVTKTEIQYQLDNDNEYQEHEARKMNS